VERLVDRNEKGKNLLIMLYWINGGTKLLKFEKLMFCMNVLKSFLELRNYFIFMHKKNYRRGVGI